MTGLQSKARLAKWQRDNLQYCQRVNLPSSLEVFDSRSTATTLSRLGRFPLAKPFASGPWESKYSAGTLPDILRNNCSWSMMAGGLLTVPDVSELGPWYLDTVDTWVLDEAGRELWTASRSVEDEPCSYRPVAVTADGIVSSNTEPGRGVSRRWSNEACDTDNPGTGLRLSFWWEPMAGVFAAWTGSG